MMGMGDLTNSGKMEGAKGEAKSGSAGTFGNYRSAGINFNQSNQLITLLLACALVWAFFKLGSK